MGDGTNIGKVRGLGSAGHGGDHWLAERASSVACLLLWVWFAVSLALMPDFGQNVLAQWLAQTSVAVPMILLVAATFWHVRLGLRVLIEDYVHDSGNRMATLLLVDGYAIAATVFGIFAIAKIAFTGSVA